MNKNLQVVLVILTISFGASARLGISGWLFLFGLLSIGFLSIVHLSVHYYSINFLARANKSAIVYTFLSHLSFLGLFLFQTDFDDSKSYSAIGNLIGLNSDIFLPHSMKFWLISLSIYLLVTITILIKARRETNESRYWKYIGISLIAILMLTLFITFALRSIEIVGETKKYNEDHYPDLYSESLDSIIKNIFPHSISLAHRIRERDSDIRWVNQTFTNQELNEENKLSHFLLIDSISLKVARSGLFNNEVVFNYYFTEQRVKIKSNQNRLNFFDYSNFNKKYDLHYRVDCDMIDSTMIISKRNLNQNISKRLEADFKQEIQNWYEQNYAEPTGSLWHTHRTLTKN